MKFLWWAWRILSNVFILLIVLLALNALKSQSDKLTISVLGMIYVTIRTIGSGTGLLMLKSAEASQDQFDQLRMMLDGTYNPDRSADRAAIDKYEKRWIVDGLFLALISIACALTFFTNL